MHHNVVHDPRYQKLRQWLHALPGFEQARLTVASADASFRRYFRATTETGSWIIMDAPPGKEDVRTFMEVTRLLGAHGVNVPTIHHSDPGLGFLLLTDFGDRAWLDALDGQTADRLYAMALRELLKIQATPANALPDYDENLLRAELDLFTDWLLGRHLGLELDATQRRQLTDVFDALIDNALSQPQTFVHRDYHSRNLMLTADDRPGVIDYQDAVRGPITYDLVSLLRDCYIRWPEAKVRQWALAFKSNLPATAKSITDERFLRWFDLMGVQRHLKAAGIFCRLNHRDNKPGYLKDIPRTLGYVRDMAPRYPETRPLSRLLDRPPREWLQGASA